MKTLTVEKFRGLQVQANSFQVPEGFFEIADNVIVSRDNIVSKRRGYKSEYYFQENLAVTTDYSGERFAIGNHVYRLDQNASGTVFCASGINTVSVHEPLHGLQDGDWISEFVSNNEPFVSSFPLRFADFVGQNQITTEFAALNASASGTTVTVTQANNGLINGESIRVFSSAIGATGTFTATGVTPTSYQYTDATASGVGVVSVEFLDGFQVTASQDAIATASGVATWNDYKMLTGDLYTVPPYVPVLKTGKNMYWAANEGLHGIETTSGPVRKSGVPPALDTDAYLSGASGGVAANVQVAYRAVFGRKDANNTLHLSSPSDVVVLANTTRSVSSGGLSLATGTNVLTVTDSGNGLTNGDTIYLYNVVATPSGQIPTDGSNLVATGVSGSTFTVDFDDIGVSPTGITSIEYGTRKTATIYASIPSEISSTEYFYQIYRSDSASAAIIPDARYKLVEQLSLTSADLLRGFVSYEDELPFEIIQSNAELYTNPTQEGESQANSRPPLATDLTLFKGFSFFGNCTAYRTMALSLIQTAALANGDTITIAGDTYIFRGNATNASLGNDITTSPATVGSGIITVTQVAHGMVTNDVIYLISSSGITKTPGLYAINVTGPNAFTFATGATGTTGFVTYEGRTDASGKFLVTLTEPSSTSAETIAEGIDSTARSLIKAVNRASTGKLYAQYVSGIDESPGRILLTAKSLSEATFSAIASTATVGGCFSPVLPTSGTSVSDFQDVAKNALFVSKFLEAEAVPIINRYPIGSADDSILRVIALRDSLIIFKEDGIFRLNGDSLSNFTATALDTTVVLQAVRSASVLNNSVYALTNQGVVQVTDTAVRIVSRQIEPFLIGVLGKANLDAYTCGISYESERLYILSTVDVNSDPDSANVAYVYNYLTDAWTTWSGTALAFSGNVVLGEKISHILAQDRFDLMSERKDITKIDFTGQDSAIQVYIKRIANVSAISGTKTVCISVPANHGIIAGDVISITNADSDISSVFSSGAASVENLRTVTTVTDKIICFDADENSSASITGVLYWQRGISEIDLDTALTNGSRSVVVTTQVAHGFENGDAILVDTVSAGVLAGLAALSDITEYRPIIVLSPTTFQIKLTNAATSSVTGTINGRDKRGIMEIVTVNSNATPQNGDAFVSGGKIYKIISSELFGAETFIITTQFPCRFTSKDLVYIHKRYTSRLKFAPITMGTGVLKQFAEAQAWFRNTISCSQLSVGFSTDSRYSDKIANWTTFVGTPAGFVTFGGWGSQKWGNFPWGGGTSVELDYTTGPAVPLRTWIPQNSYLATFIQPEFVHEVAGEPLELQSIAIVGQPATQKVSK